MPKVAIILGSASDKPVGEEALPYLNYFNIEAEIHIMSAHRTPDKVQKFAESAREQGYEAIIAGAGLAAHLPGVVAAFTTLPVIGVPLSAGSLNGLDSLFSIVQMPAGVPVATMAIGKPGMRNAAIFAAQILSIKYPELEEKLTEFKANECKLPQ
ncbi:MAG: 5-(carboxyamino)imidazole ribonucleotide mutase [Calditrichia bacterium]